MVRYLLLLPLAGHELTNDPPLGHLLRFVILAIRMGPDTLVGIVLVMTSTALAQPMPRPVTGDRPPWSTRAWPVRSCGSLATV